MLSCFSALLHHIDKKYLEIMETLANRNSSSRAASQLGALVALPEASGLMLIIQMWFHSHPDALFWPPWTLNMHAVHIHACRQSIHTESKMCIRLFIKNSYSEERELGGN